MSIIVFSERKSVAPSWIIRSAAGSSIRPSKMKCCLRTSGRGLPVRVSNTSDTVSLCDGGNGTAKKRKIQIKKKINTYANNSSSSYYKIHILFLHIKVSTQRLDRKFFSKPEILSSQNIL